MTMILAVGMLVLVVFGIGIVFVLDESSII